MALRARVQLEAASACERCRGAAVMVVWLARRVRAMPGPPFGSSASPSGAHYVCWQHAAPCGVQLNLAPAVAECTCTLRRILAGRVCSYFVSRSRATCALRLYLFGAHLGGGGLLPAACNANDRGRRRQGLAGRQAAGPVRVVCARPSAAAASGLPLQACTGREAGARAPLFSCMPMPRQQRTSSRRRTRACRAHLGWPVPASPCMR